VRKIECFVRAKIPFGRFASAYTVESLGSFRRILDALL
jgi:hypothetical protein